MLKKIKPYQKTIKEKVSISGIGLFYGEKVKITLHPAPCNSGVVFKRIDLPNKPILPVSLNLVKESDRRTVLGFGKESIITVEHLLSALAAYGVDNVLIEIDGFELPICDGSSKFFAEVLESTGLKTQDEKVKIFTLDKPLHYTEGYIHLVAVPSDEYRISFTLHHPTNSYLKSQYLSYVVDENTYLKEIAPSRTYSIYEEIKPLLDKNLIRGGSLENAVVIKEGKVLNSGGVRFYDEMVRHKILDLIGDLSLIGMKFKAHIIAIRSGHFTNVKFAKKLIKHLAGE